jgi:hypothetical protein
MPQTASRSSFSSARWVHPGAAHERGLSMAITLGFAAEAQATTSSTDWRRRKPARR